jgi:hypothetical protein
LDKLSIKLHQIYRNEAELQRNRLMLHDGVVKELRNYTDKCRSTSIAFSEWFSMLSCMSSGAGVPIREYENLKDKLLNSLSELPSQTRKEAQKLLEVLDARFGVIRNSMKYTDWKQIDERLIDGIPFILTYHTELHLAIPFSTGTNTQIFRNVAVPTVVNPKQVTYVYSVTEESFLSDFRKAAAYIFKYLPEKNLRAKIHFVLAYKKSTVTAGQMRDVQQELKTAYSKVGRVILLEADEESNAFDMIKTVLQDTLHVHAFEKNLTGLSGLLDEAGVYEAFPSYSFHIKSKEFYDSNGCNYLNYIRARQYLKASDMFASKDAKGIMRSPLTFYKNYEALWNTYREHKPAWKRLCALLEQYHEGNTVVSIQTDSCSSEKDGKEYYFLRPTECYAGAD